MSHPAYSTVEHHRTLTGTHFPSRVGYEAELAWVVGYILRLFARPKTVTHPGTNRARRRVTSLIRQTSLPVRHAATTAFLDGALPQILQIPPVESPGSGARGHKTA